MQFAKRRQAEQEQIQAKTVRPTAADLRTAQRSAVLVRSVELQSEIERQSADRLPAK